MPLSDATMELCSSYGMWKGFVLVSQTAFADSIRKIDLACNIYINVYT